MATTDPSPVPPARGASPAPSPPPPLVGIVILNWNGWEDTIEAVASTRALAYANHRVYVVDNASTDGSETRLRHWDPGLAILRSGGNLGWSGGNNVGIAAALRDGCRHVLLLNNDALARPDTLDALVEAAETLDDAAALGSLIVAARDPDQVEFGGAHVDERTRLPVPTHGRLRDMEVSPRAVPMVAVKGCSMMLTARGLARVGLLTEDYFLNFDETDWCYRANAAGLRNYLVGRSVVEHKGAASFGGTEGPLYHYFITRNRLVFARRHLDRRGRRYAWRGAFWQFRQAWKRAAPGGPGGLARRLALSLTVVMAVADHCRGRLGDCPPLIRGLNRRFRSAPDG